MLFRSLLRQSLSHQHAPIAAVAGVRSFSLRASGRQLTVAARWTGENIPNTAAEIDSYVEHCEKTIQNTPWKHDKPHIIVAPPTPLLPAVVEACEATKVLVSAQNCAKANENESDSVLACSKLKEMGVQWVILGEHTDRLEKGDTDEDIATKAATALQNNLNVMVCIGDTEKERQEKRTYDVLQAQMKAVVDKVEPILDIDYPQRWHRRLVFVYEPQWHVLLHAVLCQLTLDEVRCRYAAQTTPAIAAETRFLYGGHMYPGKLFSTMSKIDVDGIMFKGKGATDSDLFNRSTQAAVTADEVSR